MDKFNEILDMSKDKSTQAEQDEILLQPFVYIQQIPGKQIRSKLARAFNHWLNIPMEKLCLIGEIVQMLHNSSLLIDDIEDNSILRRGIPVAHSIYGIASTINAANYVLFLALEKVQLLDHPEATKVYTEQLLELHRGQGMEIYWRDNFTCPSESDYKLMTVRKTGGLFMLAIRLMQLFSTNKKDFSKLTAILGLYFQIRDDYCNLSMKEYTENKSFCEDLTEGKFSFPMIHAVQNQKSDKQVLHILRQRTRDVEVKKYCISLLEKLGSFKYTRETLEALDKQAREEVTSFGPNPIMETLLNELLSWKTSSDDNKKPSTSSSGAPRTVYDISLAPINLDLKLVNSRKPFSLIQALFGVVVPAYCDTVKAVYDRQTQERADREKEKKNKKSTIDHELVLD